MMPDYKRLAGNYSHLLLSVLLLLLLAGIGRAQNLSGSTPLGMAPGAPADSYNLNSFENS